MKFEDLTNREKIEAINTIYNQSFPLDLCEREGYELAKGQLVPFIGAILLNESREEKKE